MHETLYAVLNHAVKVAGRPEDTAAKVLFSGNIQLGLAKWSPVPKRRTSSTAGIKERDNK